MVRARRCRANTRFAPTAAARNNDAVKLLLEFGADPDIANKLTGYSPLFLAASGGSIDSIRLLLKHAASLYMPADSTTRIIDILRPRPSRTVVRFLEGNGW